MSESMVDRYAKRGEGLAATLPEPEPAETDLGCFGWLRGMRERAPCLELRKSDGRILAVGYAWIDRMEFDPDSGITLHAGAQTIRLEGSGLNHEVRPGVRLFEGLARQRVPWVREVECGRVVEGHQMAKVECITWDE